MRRVLVVAVALVDDEHDSYVAAVDAGIDPLAEMEAEVLLGMTETGHEGEDLGLAVTVEHLTFTVEDVARPPADPAEAIAAAIRARRASGSSRFACDDIAWDLANIVAADDKVTFLAAAGVEIAGEIKAALDNERDQT